MTTRIDIEVSNTHIKGIKTNIKEIKNELITEAKKNRNKTIESNKQKLNELHTEYENVAQLRLDQLNAIQTQWQFYQEDTKPSRKKEILKRQADFEKDLELAQKESDSVVNQQAICHQLVDILKAQDRIQILNQSDSSDSTVDFSVVIIPHDILELFWSVGIKDVPVTKSDIPSTILYLEDMLKKI